jgi:predicted phage gp36 major capsid-like protein
MVKGAKASPRTRNSRDQLAVVLESMQADFRGFGEALQSFREHVDVRFEEVDARFDRVERDISLLKDASLETARDLRSLRISVERKVDRDEVEALVEGVRAGGALRR